MFLGILAPQMGAERTDIIVVMVTTSNQEEASKISDVVVGQRLAACASTIPTVNSTYWWDGKMVNDQESLVLIKTTTDKFPSLQEAIQKVHSYKVPEIIAFSVCGGLPPYLAWVRSETR